MNFTKSDIGMLGSILAIAYGVSKFTSGIISDRSNPRYFMAIGLILTGVCNLLFGFVSSLAMFGIFWGLNGWFQGWGWPACTKQLTHWYGRTERGRWYSVCSTSHTIGGFVIAILAANCGQHFGWRWGMYVPGILCIFVGFWLINRLRDVPQSLGLPPIEVFKDESRSIQPESSAPLSVKRILFDHVFALR
jgi:OPA family sugar phosphate sensor protein UhpC-like MFS transporter